MNQSHFKARAWIRTARRVVAGLLTLQAGCHPSLHAEPDTDQPLAKALSFHATFDHGPDADMGRGDLALYHAATLAQRQEAVAGLPADGSVKLSEKPGRFGKALEFTKSQAPIILFKADRNFPAPRPDWAGTVSVWLKLEPARDLSTGFCDPIQLTSKQWDDAALFLEFEKRDDGIPFRLGAYADTAVWNPLGKKWEEIPAAEKPLVTVAQPPFGGDQWTHVAFVIEHFNTGQPNGTARLYLNGAEAGVIGARTQTFTWEPERAVLLLGVAYVGLMDDLALFDRALSGPEIARLFALKEGAASLRQP